MKKSRIILFILMINFMIGFIGCYVKANSNDADYNEELNPIISVVDLDGNKINYIPKPGNNETITILNTNMDYTDCTFAMITKKNYGNKIETTFGNFIFKQKDDNGYIYMCPVNSKDITERKGEFTLKYKAINLENNREDNLSTNFVFYKTQYKNNANLKIGDKDIIKDGNIINDFIENSYTIYYTDTTNTLEIDKYDGNIFYSNMSSTFVINNQSINTSCTLTTKDDTGIILEFLSKNFEDESSKGLIRGVELKTTKITEGETYKVIKSSLDTNTSKFYAYDISTKFADKIIQPNGKVKVKIPLLNDIDSTKIAIYSISEKGEKTEIKQVIETINNQKYATFETNHLSTYVIAEKSIDKNNTPQGVNNNNNNTNQVVNNNKNNNTTQTVNNNKNNNKNDTTKATGKIPKTGIVKNINILLIVLAIVLSVITYNRYKKIKEN